MTSPELISYIRAQLASGKPRESVRSVLVRSGWASRDLDEAFSTVMQGAAARRTPAIRPSRRVPKLVLSIGLVVVSAAYALSQYTGGQSSVSTALAPRAPVARIASVPAKSSSSSRPPSFGVPSAAPAPVSPAAAAPASTKPLGPYADGAYTGSVANAYYGLVQVEAIVRNGQLADVKFLQYPNDRSTSRYISSQATPLLTEEAVQVQNANVDVVSGATFTSQAFRQSLAAALAQARA